MKHDTKTYERGLTSESAGRKLHADIDAKMQEAAKMERKIQAEKAKNDIRKFLIKEIHNTAKKGRPLVEKKMVTLQELIKKK